MMFIATDQDAYVRAATRALLTGAPFESLADWAARAKAEEATAKVVDLADMRRRLRPAPIVAER